MKKKSDDTDLLNEFRVTALNYGEALEIGNHKAANKAARIGAKLKKEIVARGSASVCAASREARAHSTAGRGGGSHDRSG